MLLPNNNKQTNNQNLPLQEGSVDVQSPSGSQVRDWEPDSVKPMAQLYVAVLPKVVPDDVSTSPLVGFVRGPQSTAESKDVINTQYT